MVHATRRSIVAIAAVSLFVAIASLLLSLTTHGSDPACPHCGFSGAHESKRFPDSTCYWCGSCGKDFIGPPRGDFSWADSALYWLDE